MSSPANSRKRLILATSVVTRKEEKENIEHCQWAKNLPNAGDCASLSIIGLNGREFASESLMVMIYKRSCKHEKVDCKP
jgi:hypothetical protein